MNQMEKMIQACRDWGKTLIKRSCDSLKEEIELETILRKTGDASKVINIFQTYGLRVLPESGENLDITLGKVKKWLSDLQPVAVSGSYEDLFDSPVKDAFKASIDAVTAAEEITLCQWSDFANVWGAMGLEAEHPMLIYGSGGATATTKTGTTDFVRAYLVYKKREDSSTYAGAGWTLVQLGSAGSTARWTLTAKLTTASSQEHSLVLKVPKGSWAHVNAMTLPD